MDVHKNSEKSDTVKKIYCLRYDELSEYRNINNVLKEAFNVMKLLTLSPTISNETSTTLLNASNS